MRHLLFCTKDYSYEILRPLQEAALALGHEVAWFCRGTTPRLRAEESQLKSISDVARWKPDVVYSAGNWTPTFVSGLKVQVFHGFSVDKRSRARGHFRIRDGFDLYCTQGPDTTKPFEAIADKKRTFRVRETGWSKMDGLVREQPKARSIPAGKPCVLFGSTFSRELTAAPVLADEIERLSLSGEWHWLVTLHPKMDAEFVRRYRDMQHEHLEFVETADLLPAMKAAQLLVTDTSSIGAEFLLQRRPLVTFRNRKPSPYMLNVTQVEELAPAVRAALDPSVELMNRISEQGDHIHPYRDGRSAERVVAAAIECIGLGRDGLKRKRTSLFRDLQSRKRLRYWPWAKEASADSQ
ncbi:MAG: CDP-glycerol glycerophosphotransferase (TagB/SpsB family) [Planctomycetota bacterium]|jgi:CDP-glycerol glycerophosphotransferase (TagB/SpsB family)